MENSLVTYAVSNPMSVLHQVSFNGMTPRESAGFFAPVSFSPRGCRTAALKNSG